MASEKVQSPAFRDYLVRLVRAAGETLVNHADEIVGKKAGTHDFTINITFPADDACGRINIGLPMIEVRQSYLSDEAIAASAQAVEITVDN